MVEAEGVGSDFWERGRRLVGRGSREGGGGDGAAGECGAFVEGGEGVVMRDGGFLLGGRMIWSEMMMAGRRRRERETKRYPCSSTRYIAVLF